MRKGTQGQDEADAEEAEGQEGQQEAGLLMAKRDYSVLVDILLWSASAGFGLTAGGCLCVLLVKAAGAL